MEDDAERLIVAAEVSQVVSFAEPITQAQFDEWMMNVIAAVCGPGHNVGGHCANSVGGGFTMHFVGDKDEEDWRI